MGSDTDGVLKNDFNTFGTGKDMKMRTYSMKYEITDGNVDCGVNCRRQKLRYDEHMRLDSKTKAELKLFHREVGILNRVRGSVLPLFADLISL